MPKDKSQLDIYQIERETVVAEICKSLAPEQQAEITTLLETVSKGVPTAEDIRELSESIVGYIIRTQNNKPKALHYDSIPLLPNTVRGYTLQLYEASSCPHSPIAAILQDRATQPPRTGINVSHILFAYDQNTIYAVCSGAGWQVVTPFSNSQFGLNILSRLVSPNEEAISSARYRGFSGVVAAQDTSYRQKTCTAEVAEFGRLFKDLSGQISAEVVRDELGLDITGSRKFIGADFKNTFKVRKSITLSELGDLFIKITELMNEEPIFSIEDWLGITPVGKTQREKTLCEVLIHEALSKICRAALDDTAEKIDVFICDPKMSAYRVANRYVLVSGDIEQTYDEFGNESALNEYISLLSSSIPESDNREEQLIQMLINTTLDSFSEGNTSPDTSSSLTKCLQLSIVYQRRTYILIEGEWFTVYDGLNTKLNRDLPQLVSSRTSSLPLPAWDRAMLEDNYLNLLSSQYSHAKLHRRQPLDRVELCDTVILNGKKLIFCHAKVGFDTTMRVLTAQVRSSANVLAGLRAGNRIDILRSAWQYSYQHISNLPTWEIVEKAILGIDGYNIVECILFRPDYDISESVSWSASVIAKYELSTLIKGWAYDFPLEIAIPKVSTI